MAQHRSWTLDDVQNFFTLVSHTEASQVIRRGGTLSQLLFEHTNKPFLEIIGDTSKLGITKSERYGRYLDKVKATSFGNWLFMHPDFRQAYDLFKKKHQAPNNPGYHVEWAELRFLRCASIVGFYVDYRDSGRQRLHPNSRQVTQAIKSIKKLQKSTTAGVRLSDPLKTQQLNRLLTELLETLESTKRKPRFDENSIGREFVASVSGELLRNFDDASPRIVIHLASAMGYAAHETSIQAQIQAARRRHQNEKRAVVVAEAADALKAAQKKPA